MGTGKNQGCLAFILFEQLEPVDPLLPSDDLMPDESNVKRPFVHLNGRILAAPSATVAGTTQMIGFFTAEFQDFSGDPKINGISPPNDAFDDFNDMTVHHR